MKNITHLAIAVFAFHLTSASVAATLAQRGNEGGHGGLGVERNGQAFLLDFVENNMEKSAEILDLPKVGGDYCVRRVMFGACVQYDKLRAGLLSASGKNIIREIYIETDTGYEKIFFLDAVDSYFDRMISKSSSENDYMFGKKIECGRKKCYDKKTLISATLANQLTMSIFPQYTSAEIPKPDDQTASVGFDYVRQNFIKFFSKLDWVMTNETLKNHQDENSRIKGERLVLAGRIKDRVKVSDTWWNRGTDSILPLDFKNKLGLIVHEVYYAWTESHGDLFSDRARTVASFIFLSYESAYKKYGRSRFAILADLLKYIPSIPKRSSEVVYVHELNRKSTFTIKTDIPFASTMCATFMYDPVVGEGVVFSSRGYKGSELGKERWEQILKTQRDYIHGDICLKMNDPAGYTYDKIDSNFFTTEIFTLAPEFKEENHIIIDIAEPTTKIRSIRINGGRKSREAAKGHVTVEDFNRLYGHLFEITP